MSVSALSPKVLLEHRKTNDGFAPANVLPKPLRKIFPNLKWTDTDCANIARLYKILVETAERTGKGFDALPAPDRDVVSRARQDLLGRGISTISLADVEQFPCLSMLYRHYVKWEAGQSGNKRSKPGSLLSYAYLLYIGWRVYGDTIGRMLDLDEYLRLRDSLFSFLGLHCQSTLHDFFGPNKDPNAPRKYVNWDHKQVAQMVDLDGVRIKRERKRDNPAPKTAAKKAAVVIGNAAPKPNAGARGESSTLTFASRSVQLFDATRFAKHIANVKKFVDSTLKHSLASGQSEGGTVSPMVLHGITSTAKVSDFVFGRSSRSNHSPFQAMIRNALEQEFRTIHTDKSAIYVHPSEEDVSGWLPTLPEGGLMQDNSYMTLSHFAEIAPEQYLQYCYGLVQEGYRNNSKGDDDSAAEPSPAVNVNRRSDRVSGEVLPQDLDWTKPWAKVKASD